MLHGVSVAAFCGEACGYVALSSLLQRRWYFMRSRSAASWRCQASVTPHAPDGEEHGSVGRAWVCGLPALEWVRGKAHEGAVSTQRRRHRLHARFATCNLLLSASFAAAVTELTVRGRSSLTRHCGDSRAACSVHFLSGLLASLIWQSVLEYYWHAAMHTSVLYQRFHRFHHTYKSPQPFDDLFIHPLEACGYYAILFSPAVAFPELHLASFLAYMALCGVFGVLDHSGIKLRLGSYYDTRAHDAHHEKGWGAGFYLNLAFPFTVMDRLHGTYAAPDAPRPASRRRGTSRRLS